LWSTGSMWDPVPNMALSVYKTLPFFLSCVEFYFFIDI
jgi:hypothetical protein